MVVNEWPCILQIFVLGALIYLMLILGKLVLTDVACPIFQTRQDLVLFLYA
jgi:hypothetical protein